MTKFDQDYGEKVEGPEDALLIGQQRRVYDAMRDGQWRSLADLKRMTGDLENSISARLRDLRKESFGYYLVEKRKLKFGPWQYRLGDRGAWTPRKRVHLCDKCGSGI
jgi:hypothetical protein